MSIRDEFIGTCIEVIQSKNRSLVGLKGKVVDETKNTFIINVDRQRKTILKKDSTFSINGKVVEGSSILKRAEERIKLKEN